MPSHISPFADWQHSFPGAGSTHLPPATGDAGVLGSQEYGFGATTAGAGPGTVHLPGNSDQALALLAYMMAGIPLAVFQQPSRRGHPQPLIERQHDKQPSPSGFRPCIWPLSQGEVR